MSKTNYNSIQFDGDIDTIGSETITIQEYDADGNILKCSGTTKPTDTTAGYAKGAQFIDTNASAGSILYINEGTSSSCDFNLITNTGSVDLSGDVSGASGSNTVDKINGVALGTTTATSGNVLYANGTNWATATPDAAGLVDKASAQTITAAKTMGTNTKILFRDSALSINSSADGQLDLAADTKVQITTPTTAVSAALTVGGNTTLGDAITDTISMNGLTSFGTSGSPKDTSEISTSTYGFNAHLTDDLSEKSAVSVGGADFRATSTGGAGDEYVKGVQGVATASTSSNVSDVIAGNFVSQVAAGTTLNAYGVVGQLEITSGADVSAIACGVLGLYNDEDGVADTGNITGAVMGYIGDKDTASPDGAIVAVLEGDSVRTSSNPANAAFKVIDKATTPDVGFNYGVDLYYSNGSLSNTFLEGDIRLSNGNLIKANSTKTELTGAVSLASTVDIADTTLIATDKKLQFRDSALTISSTTDGQLDIAADTKLQLTSATTAVSAALSLAGDTTVATDKKMQFRDTGLYINSSADGQLDIAADTTLAITAPATTVSGSVTMATDKKIQLRDTAISLNSSADGQMDVIADGVVKITTPSTINTGVLNYAETAGTAPAYTLAVPITALVDGAMVMFKTDGASTDDDATLNVNSLGAKPLCKASSGAQITDAGVLVDNGVYLAIYSTDVVVDGGWMVQGV